jgi:hypothetical protein
MDPPFTLADVIYGLTEEEQRELNCMILSTWDPANAHEYGMDDRVS